MPAVAGQRNGRAKIEDWEVRWARAVFSGTELTHERIGGLLGVSARHARRICAGMSRGPFVERVKRKELIPLAPFDESQRIRCKGCGCPAHPSRVQPLYCFGCVSRGLAA